MINKPLPYSTSLLVKGRRTNLSVLYILCVVECKYTRVYGSRYSAGYHSWKLSCCGPLGAKVASLWTLDSKKHRSVRGGWDLAQCRLLYSSFTWSGGPHSSVGSLCPAHGEQTKLQILIQFASIIIRFTISPVWDNPPNHIVYVGPILPLDVSDSRLPCWVPCEGAKSSVVLRIGVGNVFACRWLMPIQPTMKKEIQPLVTQRRTKTHSRQLRTCTPDQSLSNGCLDRHPHCIACYTH